MLLAQTFATRCQTALWTSLQSRHVFLSGARIRERCTSASRRSKTGAHLPQLVQHLPQLVQHLPQLVQHLPQLAEAQEPPNLIQRSPKEKRSVVLASVVPSVVLAKELGSLLRDKERECVGLRQER